MSLGKTITGILLCILAVGIGGISGMYIGGFGICAANFSWSAVGGAVLLGGLLSGFFALLWRKVWWVGALCFSGFMLPILCMDFMDGDLQRFGGISISVMFPFGVAYFLARWLNRAIEKS
jgi:hypothetical protein